MSVRQALFYSPASTAILTFALSVGLSVLSVPDWLTPLPSLRSEAPLLAAKDMVMPLRVKKKPIEEVGAVAAVLPTLGSSTPLSTLQSSSQPVEEDDEPLKVVRSKALDKAELQKHDQLATTLSAHHVDIVESCREYKANKTDCKVYSLDPFFSALDDVAEGKRAESVRVVHFGDSLIASDYISGLLRIRLQARHGEAGEGLLFIDRPSKFSGLKVRTGEASSGWQVQKLPEPTKDDNISGFTGVSFIAPADEPQTSRFDVRGARKLDIYFLKQPGGGTIDLSLDDGSKTLASAETAAPEKVAAVQTWALPLRGESLTLSTRGNVRIFGVVVEQQTPGIVYDTIGLPGNFAGGYLRADETAFVTQLGHRDPQLNIIMLGGNEAQRLEKGWTSAQAIVRDSEAFIARLKAAAPQAACLVVGPLSSGIATMGSETKVRKETRKVTTLMRDVALSSGCAFWDALDAMGGEAAIVKWTQAGLMNQDLVHPKKRGADLVAHLLDSALDRAYLQRHGQSALDDPEGLSEESDKHLSRVFAKLQALQTDKTGRVAIVQLGASHTAGHMFTDEMRRRFSERFGYMGRGYVALGAPSARLKNEHIKRFLTRGWHIQDGLFAAPGQPFGLTGIRAVGKPGSAAEVVFCDDCPKTYDKTKARYEVYYLDEAPVQGLDAKKGSKQKIEHKVDVLLDGRVVGSLPEGALRPPQPTARVFSFSAKGLRHRVRLKNVGSERATLFGVAQELEKPGVIYDALGLPGATAMTADAFDKPVFTAQLQARKADLYVLFYGTNESALPKFDPSAYRDRYASLLATLRAASPDADCLIMGPTDRMELTPDGRWIEASLLRSVISSLRLIAGEQGCAFWSSRAEMGGRKSIEQWLSLDPPLAHIDHVHLSERGYQVLADQLYDDMAKLFDKDSKASSVPNEREPKDRVPSVGSN